jgi:hypothetical protein
MVSGRYEYPERSDGPGARYQYPERSDGTSAT